MTQTKSLVEIDPEGHLVLHRKALDAFYQPEIDRIAREVPKFWATDELIDADRAHYLLVRDLEEGDFEEQD